MHKKCSLFTIVKYSRFALYDGGSLSSFFIGLLLEMIKAPSLACDKAFFAFVETLGSSELLILSYDNECHEQ